MNESVKLKLLMKKLPFARSNAHKPAIKLGNHFFFHLQPSPYSRIMPASISAVKAIVSAITPATTYAHDTPPKPAILAS